MKNKGKYLRDFGLRGLVAMGFGSIVLSIVYAILGLCNVITELPVYSVSFGYLTITALAFLCGGITVVFQIEELAISKAITLHGIVLYMCYAVVYFVNNWLAKGITPFLVFTAIFIVGYLLVWIVIYLITKNSTEKINKKVKF